MRTFLFLFVAVYLLVAQRGLSAEESSRVLFDFDQKKPKGEWQIVNDGVMGGRSTSEVTITADGHMRFTGMLSLENNGGFASVRSRPQQLGLAAGQSIALRVRGDGRTYTFNLYTPTRRTAFSYRTDFETEAGKWTEVRLPLSRFVASSYGRPLPDVTLVPKQVVSVGILLGDRKPGSFEIEIDWIKVE